MKTKHHSTPVAAREEGHAVPLAGSPTKPKLPRVRIERRGRRRRLTAGQRATRLLRAGAELLRARLRGGPDKVTRRAHVLVVEADLNANVPCGVAWVITALDDDGNPIEEFYGTPYNDALLVEFVEKAVLPSYREAAERIRISELPRFLRHAAETDSHSGAYTSGTRGSAA